MSVDPAMRNIVGGRAKEQTAASTSLMGRFETEILTKPENMDLLINLSGQRNDNQWPNSCFCYYCGPNIFNMKMETLNF